MRKSDGESQSYLGVVDVDVDVDLEYSPRTSVSSFSSDVDEKLSLSDTELQEDIMTMLLHSLNLVSALSLNKGPCEICTEDHPALRCRLLSENEISAPTRLRLQQLKLELSQKKADKWKQSHSPTPARTVLQGLSAEELDAKYQAHQEGLLLPSILKDEETPERPQEVMPKTAQEEMVEKLQRQYEQQLQEIRKGSEHMKEKFERQRAIVVEDETEEQQVTRRRKSVHQEKESERAAAAVALKWSRNLHKSTRNLHTSILAAQEEGSGTSETMKKEHTIDNGSAAVIVADEDQSSTPPKCMNTRNTLQKYKGWVLFVIVAIILCIVVVLLNGAPPETPDGAYCEENGGNTEYRNEEDGVEYALCVFHDGSGTACDRGAFRRGKCDKDSTPLISLFCTDDVGNLTNVDVDWGDTVGAPPATYKVCTLQDGTECAEHSYYNGGCATDLRDEDFLETRIQ